MGRSVDPRSDGSQDSVLGLHGLGSVAMMLEDSFDMGQESKNVWAGMASVFAEAYSTADLSKPGSGVTMIKTHEFGDKVVAALRAMPKAL